MRAIKFTFNVKGEFGVSPGPILRIYAESILHPDRPKVVVGCYDLEVLSHSDPTDIFPESIVNHIKNFMKNSPFVSKELYTLMLKELEDDPETIAKAVLDKMLSAMYLGIKEANDKKIHFSAVSANLENTSKFVALAREAYEEKPPTKYYICIPTGAKDDHIVTCRRLTEFDCVDDKASIEMKSILKNTKNSEYIDSMISKALSIMNIYHNSEHAPILIHPNIIQDCRNFSKGDEPVCDMVSVYALMKYNGDNVCVVVVTLYSKNEIVSKISNKHYMSDDVYLQPALGMYDEIFRTMFEEV